MLKRINICYSFLQSRPVCSGNASWQGFSNSAINKGPLLPRIAQEFPCEKWRSQTNLYGDLCGLQIWNCCVNIFTLLNFPVGAGGSETCWSKGYWGHAP